MSERRFVIQPYDENEKYYSLGETITESELKRRLYDIARRYRCLLPDGDWKGPVSPWEFLINILLHGERERTPLVNEYSGEKFDYNKGKEADPLVDGMVRVAIDAMQNRQKKPSPAPTREEWEEWFSRHPDPSEFGLTFPNGFWNTLMEWLRQCPCAMEGKL